MDGSQSHCLSNMYIYRNQNQMASTHGPPTYVDVLWGRKVQGVQRSPFIRTAMKSTNYTILKRSYYAYVLCGWYVLCLIKVNVKRLAQLGIEQ